MLRQPHHILILQVLLLSLKRFDFDVTTQRSTKLQFNVTCDYVLQCGGHLYDLVGAIVHIGPSIECGHYVSVVISPPYEETHLAFLCDDNHIPAELRKHRLEAYLRQSYILAYERRAVATIPGVASPRNFYSGIK